MFGSISEAARVKYLSHWQTLYKDSYTCLATNIPHLSHLFPCFLLLSFFIFLKHTFYIRIKVKKKSMVPNASSFIWRKSLEIDRLQVNSPVMLHTSTVASRLSWNRSSPCVCACYFFIFFIPCPAEVGTEAVRCFPTRLVDAVYSSTYARDNEIMSWSKCLLQNKQSWPVVQMVMCYVFLISFPQN